jgi:YidC/Oxa1 family membrane protein insertase
MDNQRLLVWGFFGFLLFLTWQTWIQENAAPPEREPQSQAQPSQPMEAPGLDAGLPELPAATDGPPEIVTPAAPDTAPTLSSTAPETIVTVTTDVLDVEISTIGGTLQRATLLVYPEAKDRPDDLVELLSPERDSLGLLNTGMRLEGFEDREEPNQFASFDAERRSYDLGGADEIRVPLTWANEDGVRVEKTFTFRRGSYRIDVEQHLDNQGAEALRGAAYAQLRRRSTEQERSMFDVDTYSYDGAVAYDGEKAEKLKRDDLMDDGPYQFASDRGWVATIQHHFLSAIVPPAGDRYNYSIVVKDNIATSSLIGPAQSIAPGSDITFHFDTFVGPKLQAQLEGIDETLKLTVDYGWLTIISQPLFWLLSFVFSFVKNWGLAIILVTILIKAAFYKLTEASGRSMAKMREIQPRMKALQDRYKDDRPALSQAMMDLYKREKVNPAAGCLPILIQMPFFLAFYWVLLESVEMRQAPFALWITDLSSRDPFFILPLIMGAAMLAQQKLNPAPADPVQAKVMQIMPIMFTGFFAFFPAGLVLYWVTNTLLSIAQQWHINKVVAAENKQGRKGGSGKKKKGGKEK